MTLFVDQHTWTANDGKLHGKVAKIFDGGKRGELQITDDQQQPVGSYTGTAEAIQGVEAWRGVDRTEELSHLATELQRRYVGYMQQKEYLAYLGFAVYATAASTILLFEEGKWPPPSWGSNKTWLAAGAILVIWLLVFLYLRFELHRRRWAAMRLAGCERVLVKLAMGNLSADASTPWTRRARQQADAAAQKAAADAAAQKATDMGQDPPAAPKNPWWSPVWRWQPFRFGVGLFIPLKETHPVMELDSKYPKIFVDAWVAQEEGPATSAIKHERLMILAGWFLFALLLLNTCSRTTPSLSLENVRSEVERTTKQLQDGVTAVLGSTETSLAELRAALSKKEADLENVRSEKEKELQLRSEKEKELQRLRSEKEKELQRLRSELEKKEDELQKSLAAQKKAPQPQ